MNAILIGGIILAAVFVAGSALLIVAIWWTHKYQPGQKVKK